MLLDPELKLGEAYMDGTFVVDEGSIADFVALAVSKGLRPIDPSGRGRNGLHGTSGIRLRQFNIPRPNPKTHRNPNKNRPPI